MKDNKLYKVLRIIFLTLAIISLVFTLCKKVGLCASSGSSGDGIIYLEDFWPMPVGDYIGYETDTPIRSIVERVYSQDSWSGRVIILTYEEQVDEYIDFDVIKLDTSSYGTTSREYSSCTYLFYAEPISGNNYYFKSYRYSYINDSITLLDRDGYGITVNARSLIDESPANAPYLVYKGDFISHYPVGVFIDGNHTDVLYNRSDEVQYTYSEMVFDSDWNDIVFSDYTDLPDSPSSGDSNFSLYQWLNGQNKNSYDSSKSIFELLKGFFSWVVEPFDSDSASASLESIQVISDIRSLNNVIGTAGIFNWSDVTPASRVAFTFDFGGAVLPHHQYEINFDWYTGTVKTLILSILVTFLVVGLLVTIINNIPSMIHGHSGDSGGGSN